MRLLVVEDRKVLADAIAKGLRANGFAVDVTYDGTSGSELAWDNDYDVVILDRDLPGIHGDDLCRQVAGGHSRILMLTAAGNIEDRVEGLNLGADDYLAKPFAFSELVARVHALGRRSQPALPPILRRHGVVLDPARHVVTRDGQPVELSNKEFGVLEVLMAADGGIVSAETLLARVWDANADPFTNTVRVTIGTLRRKLAQPPLIETVRGVGYRLSLAGDGGSDAGDKPVR
jgi:DNA-binding response OmpR family regulator